jgi:hypothetical protein
VSEPAANTNATTGPFTGGKSFMTAAAVVGVLGLGATFAGSMSDTTRGMGSYLVAFAYWNGIALATLCMLCIFTAAGAQWMTVLRRQMESTASAVVVGLVFFIPIALSAKNLYLWANEDLVSKLPEHAQHTIHHKHAWLNFSGWLFRAVACFAVWIGVSFRLYQLSTSQDGKPVDPNLRQRMRVLATGAMPFLGVTLTIAAIDWIMSLEPEWYSAMFGVYYFAGSFLAAFCVLTLSTVVPTDNGLHGAKVSVEHLHNLGKFMFAFTCFWAYIMYSQFMIIWHANIPEEVSWIFARGLYSLAHAGPGQTVSPEVAKAFSGDAVSWYPLAMFLFAGHFVAPFLGLLSASLKKSRKYLTVLAVWLLFMHYLDLYWAIMPALRLINPAYSVPTPSWVDLAAFLGVGGVYAAFVVFRMRGKPAVPVNDPTLPYSLAYHNP